MNSREKHAEFGTTAKPYKKPKIFSENKMRRDAEAG